MAASLSLLTILIPWAGAFVIWFAGDNRRKLVHALAVTFSALAGLAALLLLGFTSREAVVSIPFGTSFGDFTLVPNGMGVLLTAIATVIGCLAVIFSIDYMAHEDQLARYYAFVLLFIGAMSGIVLTGNMMFLFAFWEVTALCSYILISFHNDDPKAAAGGMKALVITQIGGVGLLIGALILFANTGTFDMTILATSISKVPAGALAWAAFGILIAAAAKSAQFPFQTWLPDAMEAPTPISALIHAATMVNAGVYLLARFYPYFEQVPGWKPAVIAVGVITALLANIMGLVARDLKRVLAYSTVSQLGYMVFAIGSGSVFAAQFHLLSHAIFKALLFLGAGAVIHTAGTRDMFAMGGFGKQMPFVRNVFVIGALGLAGIPILNGFWSKELILEAGLKGSPIWVYLLMLIGAGLTACYTLRMVNLVFFGKNDPERHLHDAQPAMRAALIPLTVGTLISWVVIGPMSKVFHETMPSWEFHIISIPGLIEEVFLAPATYIALAVVVLGILAWAYRNQIFFFTDRLGWLQTAAIKSFGFEWFNSAIKNHVIKDAEILRPTQTGMLSWNLVGILGALILILIVLTVGA